MIQCEFINSQCMNSVLHKSGTQGYAFSQLGSRHGCPLPVLVHLLGLYMLKDRDEFGSS